MAARGSEPEHRKVTKETIFERLGEPLDRNNIAEARFCQSAYLANSEVRKPR
jgi:hypothetical protein